MNPNKALARWMERRGRGMQAVVDAFGKNEQVMKVRSGLYLLPLPGL